MPFKNPACCSSGKHRPFQQLHSLEATIKTILKENKHFSSKCLSVPSPQLKVLSWAKAAQHQQLPELPPGKSTRAGLSEFWLRLAIDPWKFCTFCRKLERLDWRSPALCRVVVSGTATSLWLLHLLCKTAAWAVPHPAGTPAPFSDGAQPRRAPCACAASCAARQRRTASRGEWCCCQQDNSSCGFNYWGLVVWSGTRNGEQRNRREKGRKDGLWPAA